MPLYDPYALDQLEPVVDAGAWQLWWEFNKDRLLRSSSIRTGAAATRGDAFSLGKGETAPRHAGGRASRAEVNERVVPALLAAIQAGGSYEFMQSALVTLGKIGGSENSLQFDFILKWMLANGEPALARTAAVALGIVADPSGYETLRALALGNEAGRALVTPEDAPLAARVDPDLRAFAAYGLGLLGQSSPSDELRRGIVADLVVLLEEQGAPTEDLRVSAMAAMGLVPLPVVEGALACYCGTCEVAAPESSLQAQVTYLMRFFSAHREFASLTRAHTATTLARLIEAQPAGMPPELRMGVAELLVDALGRGSREPAHVRESCALALGMVGDADADALDGWIRWSLARAAASRGELERRFALIALAQTAARPGQGEAPFAGTAEVRGELLRQLSRGRKGEQPWAALALGLLGHGLLDAGADPDPGVDHALASAMRGARGDMIGACALALGLRRSSKAPEPLMRALARQREPAARAWVALGLGLAGERAATSALEGRVLAEDEDALVQARAGLALGLLGDGEVVARLTERLAKEEDESARGALAQALGMLGDRRAIDPLTAILADRAGDDGTRTQAVVALGELADRAPLAWRARLAAGVNYRAQCPTLTSGDGSGVLDLR